MLAMRVVKLREEKRKTETTFPIAFIIGSSSSSQNRRASPPLQVVVVVVVVRVQGEKGGQPSVKQPPFEPR